jgi:hypothetical protein
LSMLLGAVPVWSLCLFFSFYQQEV